MFNFEVNDRVVRMAGLRYPVRFDGESTVGYITRIEQTKFFAKFGNREVGFDKNKNDVMSLENACKAYRLTLKQLKDDAIEDKVQDLWNEGN